MTRARINLELSAISRKRRARPFEHSALGFGAQHFQRSTVLVMVVALLGILFVVGVAFLQSVTFDARQIEADVADRQRVAAVDTLDAKLSEALNAGWLAADGTPYRMAGPELVNCVADANNDGACDDVNGDGVPDYVLNGPAYGELPYLHGTMSPLEPYLYYAQPGAPPQPRLPYAGDMAAALRGRPATVRKYFASDADPERVYIPLIVDSDHPMPAWAVDADGDGIPESRGFDLTANDTPLALPPDLRDAMVKQLNDPAATGGGVYWSARLVPHGAMVDLNWSHPELVYAVMPELFGTAELPSALRTAWEAGNRPYDAYRPEIEEAALRHRAGLPQRQLAESLVQRTFEAAVLGLQYVDPATPNKPGKYDEAAGGHRWWFHQLDERGADPDLPFWFTIMAAPVGDAGEPVTLDHYDRRHAVTTCSTDSLLLRDGAWTSGNVNSNGRGWIETMLEDPPLTATGDFHRYAIDDYPDSVPVGDPRKGRIQISLPTLEIALLGDPKADPVNNGINALQLRLAATQPLVQANAKRFIRTIQDGFTLMLRNADKSILAPVDQPLLAASLTANLIDFADSDDVPTMVEVVEGGSLTGKYVFGLERQPYVTEVYTKVVGGPEEPPGSGKFPPKADESYSVVELYNPYSVELDLSPYTLEIDKGSGGPSDSIPLTGQTIPPTPTTGVPAANAGLKILGLRKTGTTSPPLPAGIVWVSNNVAPIENTWTVRITRRHTSVPVKTIALDDFVVKGTSNFYQQSDKEPTSEGDKIEESVERPMWRMNTPAQAVPLAYWTAVVPVTKPLTGAGVPKHTLGAVNHWQGENASVTPAQRVRPVQVDFANTGSLAKAFPTTGTLLLLMRYANSTDGSGRKPFNFYLADDHGALAAGEEWRENAYQIDNGHLPVFDVGGKCRVHQAGSVEVNGKRPMGYQYLPWGQYVFDYFTALPLDHVLGQFDDPDPEVPQNFLPEVDLAGARVYGRININAAPWPVLAGLPLVKPATLPGSFKTTLLQFAYPATSAANPQLEVPLGEFTAKAIVAYRDARRIPGNPVSASWYLAESGDYRGRDPEPTNPDPEAVPTAFPAGPPYAALWWDKDPAGQPVWNRYGELRKGSGFLTVGELANVRLWSVQPVNGYSEWRMDGGVIGRTATVGGVSYPDEDFAQAAGLLVALGDWVTTRSNVWTVYGTLRGDADSLAAQLRTDTPSLSEKNAAAIAAERINKRAIRFEETIDRLPSFLTPGSSPRRIGERRVGAYNDTRAD